MKHSIVKTLLLLSLLFVSVGSTIAYLTDVEQEVNVMTLGRVEIDLIEQERNSAGTLVEFQDHHPLYPGFYPKGLDTYDKDGYWVNVKNAVDKVVTVKNTGAAPAYVRLWFAFEVTDDDKFINKIHLNRNTTDWQWKFMYDNTTGNFDFLTQNGSRYVVAIATYNQVLAPNATTPVSLRQVLLDSSATNDDYLKLGDKYSIFVVAQGMQTEGFDNAHHALTEGFGVPSVTNHPFAGMTEENVGDGNDSEFTIYPAEKIDWFTGGIQQLLPKGATFDIYDVKTKTVWKAKRWTGDNHADIEPLTQADTAQLCAIYGVDSAQDITDYERRPCLITIGSRTFACSLYGVPHGDDTIPDNNLNGVVCLHFTNSKTHGTGKVDSGHQAAIDYAYQNAPNGQKKDDIPADALVISTAEELIAFAQAVNSGYSFLNRTVVLDADIDLKNHEWNSISLFRNESDDSSIVFDGQGHTIGNLKSNSQAAGFFGHVEPGNHLTIKNLNINGAMISGDAYSGVIVACAESDIVIENCHVTNSIIECIWSGDYGRGDAAALVGHMVGGLITNSSAVACKVYSADCVGRLWGTSWLTKTTNCTAENVQLYLKQDELDIEYVPGASRCSKFEGTFHDSIYFDKSAHGYRCSDCDALEWIAHTFSCSNMNACSYCGVSPNSLDLEGSIYTHQWGCIGITNTSHTVACASCNEVRRSEDHHAYCLEAKYGICAGCGASGVTIGNTWHYSKYSNISETHHVYMCYMCGLYTSDMEPHHFDIAGKCRQCGAVKVIPATGIGEIIAESNVALRKGPSSDYVVIDRLAPGTVVELLAIPSQISAKHWYKVQYNDTVGYVQSPYIKVLKMPDETDASSFTWTSDDTSVTITKYIGTATDVVIPATIDGVPVTGIAYQAFDRCTSMTSVIIPFSVTSIGTRAFAECTSLTSVTIPNSVTSIRDKAFTGCTNLTSITISDNVTEIDYAVFAHCTSLKSITIPESVTRIGESAFSFCGSLKSITIPDSVTNIGDGAFTGCTSLTRVFLSESNQITSIGANAFWGCTSLSNIEDADTLLCLTSVGDYAFKNCSELQYFYFDEKVSEIGVGVFEGCTNINVDTFNNDYAAGYCRQNNIPGSHGGDG